MGLGTFKSGGNATYLTIGSGKDEKGRNRAVIGKRAKHDDPGAVQVFGKDGKPQTDKDGNNIYRTEYPDVQGLITKIERDSGDYGDRLNLHIADGDSSFILQLKRGDNYWVDFACRLDNMQFSKRCKLAPYMIERDDKPGKFNRLLVPYQEGQKVEKTKYEELAQGGSHAPYFDEDEKEWRWGKRDRFLDEGPIQRSIDALTGLYGDQKPELVPVENQQEVYGGGAAQVGSDNMDMPIGDDMEESDLPF